MFPRDGSLPNIQERKPGISPLVNRVGEEGTTDSDDRVRKRDSAAACKHKEVGRHTGRYNRWYPNVRRRESARIDGEEREVRREISARSQLNDENTPPCGCAGVTFFLRFKFYRKTPPAEPGEFHFDSPAARAAIGGQLALILPAAHKPRTRQPYRRANLLPRNRLFPCLTFFP